MLGDGAVETLQEADIVIVDINIDELMHFITLDQARRDAGILLLKCVDNLPDRCPWASTVFWLAVKLRIRVGTVIFMGWNSVEG